MARTLTAANATIMIGVSGLFPTPQQLQGFSADDVFKTDSQTRGEAIMGVDGHLSGGFLNVPTKQGFTLQADSVSCDLFDIWHNAEKAQQDSFIANGIIILRGVKKQYAMIRGFLIDYSPMADAGKLLKPRNFSIVWESATPSPIF